MLDSSKYDPHSPKQIHDIVGNTEILTHTAKLIKENTASHMVFVGPAGCGKSLFLHLALSGFQTLFIDCTANFGLRDVRDSVRIFARGSRAGNGNLRWIVFEHADALTSDTQAFLRRMLETTSATTRIVFECKDAGAISEPILSRSTIVTIHAPEATDATFEINRRTNYSLPAETVRQIVKHSYGNMRHALLCALSIMNYSILRVNIVNGYSVIESLLESRPMDKPPDSTDWITWAIQCEHTCRLEGIDLRDILHIGWPTNPAVATTCAQWSRLGGTSTRALFFDCVATLLHA